MNQPPRDALIPTGQNLRIPVVPIRTNANVLPTETRFALIPTETRPNPIPIIQNTIPLISSPPKRNLVPVPNIYPTDLTYNTKIPVMPVTYAKIRAISTIPEPINPMSIQIRNIQARLARAKFEVYVPFLMHNFFHMDRDDDASIFSAAIQQRRLKIRINNTIKWLMEELMTNKNLLFALQVLEGLGFRSFGKNPGTPDMYYNLLWYLNLASPNAAEINTIRGQLDYASGLHVDELLTILGPSYTGPTDRASLLFAIATGKSTHKPNIFNSPRYLQIATLPPWLVWIIAMNVYEIINANRRVSVYPPYAYWALQPQSILDPI